MAIAFFNESYYRQTNEDVLRAILTGSITSGEAHFLAYGQFEGRKPIDLFDPAYYIAKNSDVAAAIGPGKTYVSAYDHYVKAGAGEGRAPSGQVENFNATRYLADNADLKTAGITTDAAALRHYVEYGAAEKRAAYDKAGNTLGQDATTSRTLTTGNDNYTGGSGADNFSGVIDNSTGNNNTFNSADIINGGAGADTLTLLLNADGTNVARVLNVETLALGANRAGAVFDYNANAGLVQITDVTTVKADQINGGESLTVNNVLATSGTIPTLMWDNEANSLAGTVAYNFRDSAVTGAATALTVTLDDVRNGTLTLGNGIETLNVVSQGSTTSGNSVVLLDSGKVLSADSGLTRVNITGAAALGGGYTVSTTAGSIGLEVARTPATDGGQTSFVQVGANVTTVDASKATGNQFIQFTDANTNSTYLGGTAADTVILTGGNDSLSGGTGNDTFIFNNTSTSSNGTFFNNLDSIDGGTGTDTITFAPTASGAAGVTIQSSEWLNSKGVDAIDLRGGVNRVVLDDSFVGRADATSFEVITNKIVQNDSTTSVADEGNSRHVIDLTLLSATRAIKTTGGEGRESIIVTDALNGTSTLSGGNGLDALVVQNGATLTGSDLNNVSGFNVINLTETAAGTTNTYNIDLSAAFITAQIDARATNVTAAATANVLNIVSDTTDANGTALNGLNGIGTGDVVNLTVATSGLAVGAINVNDIIASGATLTVKDTAGTTILAASAGAITTAGTGIFAGASSTAVAITTASAGVGSANSSASASTGTSGTTTTGGSFIINAASAVLTNSVAGAGVTAGTAGVSFLTSGNDTITATRIDSVLIQDGSTGDADVLNAVATGDYNTTAANISGIETINVTANTLTNFSLLGVTNVTTFNVSGANAAFTQAQGKTISVGSAFSGTLTAAVATTATDDFTVRLTGNTTAFNITTDAVDGVTLNTTANAAIGTLDVGATGTVQVTGSGNLTITTLTDVVNINAGGTGTSAYSGVLTVTTAAAASSVTGGSGADVITGNTNTDSINGGAGNDTLNVSQAGADTVRGGQGNDTITLGGAADDRLVFEATAVLNGNDSLVGVAVANAAGNSTQFDFQGFASGRYVGSDGNVQTSDAVIANLFTTADTNVRNVHNGVVALNNVTALTTTQIAAEFGTGQAFAVQAGQRTVVLEGDAAAATRALNIYFVQDLDGNGAIAASEVVLVGTTSTSFELDSIFSNSIL